MGWLKVDDKLPRNPKVLAGDIETAWYYLCALTHCAEQLTDGYIADAAVPVIAPHITDPRDVAERCAQLEMFSRVDGGYQVPDYLDFNPSRAKFLADRAADRERQARKRSKDSDSSRRDTDRTSIVSPTVPSRPVPRPSPSPTTGTTGDDPQPVDNDEKLQQVIDHVIQHRARGATKSAAWKRTVARNLRTDDDGAWWNELQRLCTEYPDAPVSMLAAAAEGEKSPHLTHYRRHQIAS